MTVDEGKNLHEEYGKLKSDKERLQFFIDHKDNLLIVLDNDNSSGFIKNLDDDEVYLPFDFDCYFGNAGGVFLLFEQLGIQAEAC